MRLTSRDLKYNINKGKIENIYLFSGPEIGEKKEIIRLMETKIFSTNNPEKYTFYCGEDFNIVEFVNALKVASLFSKEKIIILKNVELISEGIVKQIENYIIPNKIEHKKFENKILKDNSDKNSKKIILDKYVKENDSYKLTKELKGKDKKAVVEAFYTIDFKNYDKDTYFIMLTETNERINQNLLNLIALQQNVIFWEMFENQKINWIRSEFKKYNLYIDDNAISFILDTIENNKEPLIKEINKIALLFKENNKDGKKGIDRSFFEEYLYHSKIETPFSLYSAMLSGNLSKAMDVLENLFLTNEYNLLSGIIWSHRRFLKALDLYENHKKSMDEIFSILKINVKRNKEDFIKGFKIYNYSHASLMFYYISELDYHLKILPSDLKLVKLQEFVINFMNGDSQKSFLQGPVQLLQY